MCLKSVEKPSFLEPAHARHSSNKLDSALAYSQIC